MNRKNHDHRIFGTSIAEIREVLSATANYDRESMKAQMINHLDYFDMRGVKNLSDLIQVLKNHGFKAKQHLDFIRSCADYINRDTEDKIYLLKERLLRMSNKGEKNILLNREALQFPDKVLKFIKIYVKENLPNMDNKDKLFQEFKLRVQQLFDQNELNMVHAVIDDSFHMDDQNFDSESDLCQQDYSFEVDQQECIFDNFPTGGFF